MILPRSFLTFFVVVSTTTSISFSALVSATDPDLGKTSAQQRELDNNQGVDMVDYNFEHDYSWNEEDGFVGMNETESSSFSLEEEANSNPAGLRGGTAKMASIQGSKDFGQDGDTMILQVSSEVQRMFSLINNERRSRGIATLCINNKLNQAALDHSNDMRNGVFFSHTGSDGSNFVTRVGRRGYSWSAIAENISRNSNIDDAHRGLMNSQGHRKNILNSRYKHIGLGITKYTSGRFGGNYVITQVFGTSSSEGCSSSGGCSDSPHNWYDSDGPKYNCDWYAEGDHCQRYGNEYSNFGKTANQACCSCGGGSSSKYSTALKNPSV